ncbi:TPA: hypothetical protein JD074_04000 [Clostridioides difficile]|uniref:DUF7210 family protein n=1 Tax=Clostridioides difficile TaxID=1496 RepID=UPI0008A411F1|nr:hypothetical protein [Clostridioides difficile]OFU27755.1 hypothetical protein HMPREF3075_14755 [Clostridium sp. HMSC19B11]EGT3846022.1 hypothetical protein [Clostridioides difficile]EGT3903094.1 hypothetical protein [Clostridioides difficile]EGT4697913.1 hypothetical protein [Clostridioides difficile]EGT4914674.1 hypothetical protein [Clostridioides difficile]
MAKKKDNLMQVKALVYLKYDNDCYKIDDIFEIRKADQKLMEENGYIEVLGEVEEKNNNEFLNKDGE